MPFGGKNHENIQIKCGKRLHIKDGPGSASNSMAAGHAIAFKVSNHLPGGFHACLERML